ncbi:anaphase-promoting complex, cyclosome, subunit 3 [Leptospira inadai serovar Lyme str. 10]|uniref:Anaphase-promoting complex, cyclosome, subunit 3 n=2 Tax=Leptospira inadai serovar Lyme TaxID=293084 RepID=V6H8B2_9LEPT|nr:tetratricopeptide repeat protein [Leptospira inadai]EQA35121.1 anaphase-promoting complex, cyclosome, subunit 3 [Leptospira inadai serovar Lyme str. 10]PNV75931.1 hypothetical protein BES34_005325 [Leptospira inadai serovar Lyme]
MATKKHITILLLALLPTVFAGNAFGQEQADYSKALAEFQSGNSEKALEIIRELHEQGKRSYETHYLAAFCHYNAGRMKSAGTHWSEALKLKPGDPAVSTDFARYLLQVGRNDDALEIISRSYEINPKNREVRLLFATALLYNAKARDALHVIEKLKSEDPNDYHPLVLEAQVYYYLGSAEKAEVSLKWAQSLVPNNPNVLNNLALVYEKGGNQEAKRGNLKKALDQLKNAKEQIEAALKIKPEDEKFRGNLQRIEARINALSQG